MSIISAGWKGKIARTVENGFAMTISATSRKRDKLAAQLTWLANREILNLPEDRRHGRFVPRNPIARLILPNGTNVTVRVIDLSASGAAVSIAPNLRPAIGAAVTIGKTRGPGGAPYREWLCHRIHPPAASRFRRSQRHRRIASPPGKRRAPAHAPSRARPAAVARRLWYRAASTAHPNLVNSRAGCAPSAAPTRAQVY